MTRVAAIDCGTNSIRLLVADLEAATGTQHDVARRMEIVRLGQGVDRTGQLAPEALARTFDALRRYVALLSGLGVQSVRMVATSATRDASNRDEFTDGVAGILGTRPEVIAGDEEAVLSFLGATRGLPPSVSSPYLVADIGGGSTEIVLGSSSVTAARSIDVGCVRLTERWFTDDPPTASQISGARADISAALDLAARDVPLERAGSLIGLAGSVTTVAGIYLDLLEYDAEKIHHTRIPAAAVREISDRLLKVDHDERAAIPVMHPGRADVIAAGALVLRCLVDRAAVEDVVVSEHDILDGIAWSLLAP